MANKKIGSNDKFKFGKNPKGEWRWNRKAPNGKIVGASTEGYRNKADCEANAKRNGWDGKQGKP
jgi:uncharacterized protein YegP (UPF0339 family)